MVEIGADEFRLPSDMLGILICCVIPCLIRVANTEGCGWPWLVVVKL